MLQAVPPGSMESRERSPLEAPTIGLRVASLNRLSMDSSNRRTASIIRLRQGLIRPNFELRRGSPLIRTAAVSVCLLLALLWACASWLVTHLAAADNAPTTPILVELFTSEGCSSCPPADALLEKMDSLQPIPGTQLIVLSEHVDYWNHDGWTDPFSSASITDRQGAYVRALGLKTAFTPQFLVDGTEELKAHNNEQVVQLLQKAASAPKVPMRLESVSVEPGNPAIVKGRVESDLSSEKHKADVYVAIALDHAESQVSRGENNGRHLSHVAVVTELTKVGKLEPGRSLGQDFRIKLKLPGPAPTNLRIVAFAQESGPGKVIGVVLKSVAVN
jgi:hypothetical protein